MGELECRELGREQDISLYCIGHLGMVEEVDAQEGDLGIGRVGG